MRARFVPDLNGGGMTCVCVLMSFLCLCSCVVLCFSVSVGVLVCIFGCVLVCLETLCAFSSDNVSVCFWLYIASKKLVFHGCILIRSFVLALIGFVVAVFNFQNMPLSELNSHSLSRDKNVCFWP